MSFHEQLQLATGVDATLLGVGLFMAMAFVMWTLTHLVDRPEIASYSDQPADTESGGMSTTPSADLTGPTAA
jgi:hypothetical protein